MQGVIGAITGGAFGLANIWSQHRQQKRASELAQKQFDAARQASINEEQQRAKANARQPDIDDILNSNTTDKFKTDLTGGKVKNKLFKPVGKLGGSNVG